MEDSPRSFNGNLAGNQERHRTRRRTIDLDLIDFGGLRSSLDEMILPHPRAHARDFVLAPLGELKACEVCRLLCGCCRRERKEGPSSRAGCDFISLKKG
jgi:7,8-dihydro-6-hydroxymethylpterin-pyrophosphokinase